MLLTYVIYNHTNSCIKVGYTNNLTQRFSNIQNGNSEKLSVILTFQGGLSTEKALHSKLRRYRIRGEWFAYNNEVLFILKKFLDEQLAELTFSNVIEKIINEDPTKLIIERAHLLLNSRKDKNKISIPELRKSFSQDLKISTREIEQILLNAGWKVKKFGTCATKFFTKVGV